MADLITVAQFEVRTGRTLTPGEIAQTEAIITDASALAVDIVDDASVTDLWDAATPGTVPAAAVPVVVAMVRRGLDNPHGYTSESQHEYTYQGASGVGVFATTTEAKLLRKAAGKNPVAALDLEGHLPGSHSYGGVSWLDGAL